MLKAMPNPLYQLTPCPLCKKEKSSSLGCCARCAKGLFKPIHLHDSLALGNYEASLERAIRQLKYYNVTSLAKLFAQALASEVSQAGWQVDIVSSVPLHWQRYLQRGYNQSNLIAKPLAEQLGVEFKRLLRRTKATKQQAKLSKEARLKNMHNVFQAKALQGEHVLLIDDVITTGTTINECKQVLLKAGASDVKFASVARALQRFS